MEDREKASKIAKMRKRAEDKTLPQEVRNQLLDNANKLEQEMGEKASGMKYAKGGAVKKKKMAEGGDVMAMRRAVAPAEGGDVMATRRAVAPAARPAVKTAAEKMAAMSPERRQQIVQRQRMMQLQKEDNQRLAQTARAMTPATSGLAPLQLSDKHLAALQNAMNRPAMAKGGAVKKKPAMAKGGYANCGASMKPQQKGKK